MLISRRALLENYFSRIIYRTMEVAGRKSALRLWSHGRASVRPALGPKSIDQSARGKFNTTLDPGVVDIRCKPSTSE